MTDKNVQVKPSKVAATPNAKVRPSAPVAKALTTPRNNQKKVSNVEPFRSVQSGKKVLTVGVPKSRVVSSKALVFPSPKKVIKIKNSMELKTPMRALCSLPVKKNEEGGSKSSSLKMTDKNVQVKPLSKVAATPNAKVRPSAPVAKALTTPRNNQKKVSNVEPFRSVQSGKKVLTVGVPKSRVMSSKALVFPSPKKVIKIKSSMELKTPMRALCSLPVKKNEEGGSKSSSLKMTDKNVQVKPLSKVAATPNGKVRPSAPVAKALTTPRNNQKKVSNVEPFRSVQSGKKVLTVGVPKSRVVSSKALVFPSPKKVIKIKSSMELKTPMRALCSLPVKKNEEGGSKSSSLKMTDKNVQVKPLSKVAATPNGKVRPSAPVAKALTTPRNNQKKVSNVEPFRSVQSGKKVLTVGVPKSRVVSSKALVFPSPKKVIKIKSSMELKTPMRALCSLPVKKNEEGGSKSLPVTASKKQLRGREVKSRVFDFLSSNNRKEPETKSMSSLVKGGGTATRKHQNTDYYSSCDEKSRPKTQKNQSVSSCTEEHVHL
ncbi:hypothetical protein V8G54_011947 [Vigna mungo]|uniref:Uncharacterized protein n=1 Tax=Vigna mungo TaxID=3915 RepID=A0AAQ3NQI2_VIGMU